MLPIFVNKLHSNLTFNALRNTSTHYAIRKIVPALYNKLYKLAYRAYRETIEELLFNDIQKVFG